MALRMRPSNCPAGPTKGSAAASSSAPGALPTRTMSAMGVPAEKTSRSRKVPNALAAPPSCAITRTCSRRVSRAVRERSPCIGSGDTWILSGKTNRCGCSASTCAMDGPASGAATLICAVSAIGCSDGSGTSGRGRGFIRTISRSASMALSPNHRRVCPNLKRPSK